MPLQDQNKPQPPNSFLLGCTGFGLGGVVGGIGGFLLPPVYYQFTNPRILQDGQWGLVYLLSIPAGVIIGAIAGALIEFLVAVLRRP
ncbi:MAG TPA: hypothetical protein VF600_03845 [Abditibacteriaceae bacterium]|jgi:hypothetical protein